MLLDRIIFKPRGEQFDLERVHKRLRIISGSLPDPVIPDVFLLAAPTKFAHEAVLSERERNPDRMPFVGIVELGADRIVLHQNTTGPGFESCRSFLFWMAKDVKARIYDDLGRRLELHNRDLHRRKPQTKLSAGDAELPAAGPAEAALMADLEELPLEDDDGASVLQMYAPIQRSRLYDKEDGTVVRIYPKGSLQIPGPSYQIGVRLEAADRFRGPESIAFLVDDEGNAVPRHLMDCNCPYPPDEMQDLIFKRMVMAAGTRNARDAAPDEQ